MKMRMNQKQRDKFDSEKYVIKSILQEWEKQKISSVFAVINPDYPWDNPDAYGEINVETREDLKTLSERIAFGVTEIQKRFKG